MPPDCPTNVLNVGCTVMWDRMEMEMEILQCMCMQVTLTVMHLNAHACVHTHVRAYTLPLKSPFDLVQ